MDKIINKTQSICNVCGAVIPATTILKQSRVFIEKECPRHGRFECDHVWDDPYIYGELSKLDTVKAKPDQTAIMLTYKCNMHCPVCCVKANQVNISDFKTGNLDKVNRYKTIFLTGGEPTLRPDLIKIVRILKKRKKRIVLLTNGIKLASEEFVKSLKKSGLSYVMLQFDTLDGKDNRYLRGKNLVAEKKKAIKNMELYGLPYVLYSVILRKKNDKTLEAFLRFALKLRYAKAIAVNPLWRIGRYNKKDFLPSSKIVEKSSIVLGINKTDWVESTKFLCNLDKLISMVKARGRVFGKCILKCLFITHRERVIPLTRVFNIVAINSKIDKIYSKRSYLGLFGLIVYFIFDQVGINFITNKNFRIFAAQLVKNKKYLFRKNYILFSPIKTINLAIFPIKANLDHDFLKDCNFHMISSDDLRFRPSCLKFIEE